jgi:hypothetical protein
LLSGVDLRHVVKYPTILICLNVPRAQQTREALGAFQKAEIERWWPILKEAGIKVE